MKHGVKVSLMLVFFYVIAQVIGLVLMNIDSNVKVVDGETSLEYDDTFMGERPDMSPMGTLIYIILGVAVGTTLILLIIKYGKLALWKLWFLLASFLAMALSLNVVISQHIALGIAFALALAKVYRSNLLIHNITELLMYSGIAIFIVPMLDLTWAVILLIAFSAYDAYAVWHSKHMVKMAEFQAGTNLFAGLTVPYKGKDAIRMSKPKKMSIKKSDGEGIKTAILGGGDIAFPMIFTGAVMNFLILNGMEKTTALNRSLIVTVCSAIALYILFYCAEKEKYYPAMPFITAGCLIGLGVVLLLP